MPMKYWRRLVRNKYQVKLLAWLSAFTVAAFVVGCQQSTYHKFEKDSEVPRISIEEAKAAYDADSAIIVDARAQVTYDQEHIAKAINIPFGGTPTDEQLAKLPKGKKIIVYCS
jgi:3-mercaptopyruvate sulfurtransferase SseA